MGDREFTYQQKRNTNEPSPQTNRITNVLCMDINEAKRKSHLNVVM